MKPWTPMCLPTQNWIKRRKKKKDNSPPKSVLLSNQHNSQNWRDKRAVGPLVFLGLMEFTLSSGWEIGTRWQGGKEEAWTGRAGCSADEITARILDGRAERARDCCDGRAKGEEVGPRGGWAHPPEVLALRPAWPLPSSWSMGWLDREYTLISATRTGASFTLLWRPRICPPSVGCCITWARGKISRRRVKGNF